MIETGKQNSAVLLMCAFTNYIYLLACLHDVILASSPWQCRMD